MARIIKRIIALVLVIFLMVQICAAAPDPEAAVRAEEPAYSVQEGGAD